MGQPFGQNRSGLIYLLHSSVCLVLVLRPVVNVSQQVSLVWLIRLRSVWVTITMDQTDRQTYCCVRSNGGEAMYPVFIKREPFESWKIETLFSTLKILNPVSFAKWKLKCTIHVFKTHLTWISFSVSTRLNHVVIVRRTECRNTD